MNQNEALQLTIDQLKGQLPGFRFLKSYSGLVKKESWGFKSMGLRLLNYWPSFQFEFGFAVSHKVVEDIDREVQNLYGIDPIQDMPETMVWGYPGSTGSNVNDCPEISEPEHV